MSNDTIKVLRSVIYPATLLLLFLFPGFLMGQDLTLEEQEKFQEIRETLLREGFIQGQTAVTTQSASVEPLITQSSYTGKSLSVSTSNSRASDFRPNGARFYILGRDSENIAEYNLSSSWEINTGSFSRSLDISSDMSSGALGGNVTNGLYIRKDDGKKMWVLNRKEIWEYTLSTAWDVSSATQTGYKDLSSHLVRGHDIDFRPNGKVLYVDDRIVGVVYQFNLSTAWDVETAEFDYAFDISGQQEEVRGTQFNQDGTRMFLMDTSRKRVLEYYVSAPYNLRSASFNGSFSVSSQSDDPRGLTFKPDFSRFYVTDASDNRVYQYKIATADPDESTVVSSKSKVIANGTATSRITITLRDQDGSSLSGRNVSLSSNSSNSSINSVNSTTDSDGKARFDVSNSAEENVTFTAKTGDITINQTVSVRFVGIDADESTVVSSRSKVIANGTATSRITVTARDSDGDRLEGVRISLSSNSSNVTVNNIRRDTDSKGEALFDVSNTTAESVRFTASGMGTAINQNVTVRFVTVDAAESSVASSRQKVHANGVASSTITVVARDEDGDELQGVDISLRPDGGDSKIEAVQNPTNSDGMAEFRVINSTAEAVEYRASGFGVTINDRVTVNFIPIDADESEMSISTQKILANGNAEATITITARDEDGDPFSNTDITLHQSGGSSEVTNVQKTTDSEGKAIFRAKSENVAEITYSASALGVTISQTITARFVTVDPGESTIAVNPENVQANGEEESTITVTTRDEDGDVLHDARVILDALNGSSTIDDSEKTTDENGRVVFTVTNEIPQIVEYTVTAEGVELPDHISVGFIPIAPVALSATQVQTRSFTANWEIVRGADFYVIDVATDSSFTNLVEPYSEFDTGNVTTFTVEDVAPGTTYLYRVRAVSDGLTGASSQTIQTTTFPETPEAVAASERNALKFTANWNQADGAKKYRLDVARDASFDNIIAGYNNIDAGSSTGYTVDNLAPGENYYYRVRSEADPRVSGNSNVIETSTLTISSEQSEISSDQLKVLANGNQSNELSITVKSDEGILLEGLEVILNQETGNSEIEGRQPVTDENGVAIFGVTSVSAGTSTYTVLAAGKQIGQISVEFLQDDGVLRLGNNFPNPFLVNSKIPITIPRPMNVELVVYNSLGVPVRTLKDENMDEGFFEIPFNGADLAAGVYFYRLITDDGIKTGKMVLVK